MHNVIARAFNPEYYYREISAYLEPCPTCGCSSCGELIAEPIWVFDEFWDYADLCYECTMEQLGLAP